MTTEAERIAAMRRRAQWELGSADWADILLSAYKNPDDSNARLDAEQES